MNQSSYSGPVSASMAFWEHDVSKSMVVAISVAMAWARMPDAYDGFICCSPDGPRC